MRKDRRTEVTHYFIPYEYKIYGYIIAFFLLFVVIPICFPAFRNFNDRFQEQAKKEQEEIVARIEEGDVDEAFGDVSEFVTPDTCYSQLRKYEGKIVSFTGRVAYFLDTGAVSSVNVDSNLLPLENTDYSYLGGNYYANIYTNSVRKDILEPLRESKDKILVVGQVCGADYNVIKLQYCKIELCNDE